MNSGKWIDSSSKLKWYILYNTVECPAMGHTLHIPVFWTVETRIGFQPMHINTAISYLLISCFDRKQRKMACWHTNSESNGLLARASNCPQVVRHRRWRTSYTPLMRLACRLCLGKEAFVENAVNHFWSGVLLPRTLLLTRTQCNTFESTGFFCFSITFHPSLQSIFLWAGKLSPLFTPS